MYIQHALEGIATQTVKPFELIIIDDASTDNSMAIIQSYASRYQWIQVHRNRINKGAYQSAQYGLEIATGDYVYFTCSDDRILRNFVEVTLKAFSSNPNAGLVCSQPSFFEKNDKILID